MVVSLEDRVIETVSEEAGPAVMPVKRRNAPVLWSESKSLACLVCAVGIVAGLADTAQAQDKLLSVTWSDPEIATFVEARKEAAARGLTPAQPSPLDQLKLPVLAFEGAPGLVQSSFPGLGPQPTGTREVHTDPTNPVWYQVVDTYGDVSVSVSADLRIQHTFDASYPLYDTKPPGAAPSAGPQVSVFDGTVEDGMEGAIAEYTIMRFGVPYTVTIECTAATKDRCADVAQIAKDSELLKLVAANPPR